MFEAWLKAGACVWLCHLLGWPGQQVSFTCISWGHLLPVSFDITLFTFKQLWMFQCLAFEPLFSSCWPCCMLWTCENTYIPYLLAWCMYSQVTTFLLHVNISCSYQAFFSQYRANCIRMIMYVRTYIAKLMLVIWWHILLKLNRCIMVVASEWGQWHNWVYQNGRKAEIVYRQISHDNDTSERPDTPSVAMLPN